MVESTSVPVEAVTVGVARMALAAANGNMARAARGLQIERRHLMDLLGIPERRGRAWLSVSRADLLVALEAANSEAEAARALGVSRTGLRSLIRRLQDGVLP